ncbi:MAG: hypothetical protein A3C42_03705 [Chlamydiae bacterium RIFCSPHIGHO2_02_FULL_45_9]|nr:MAG: hypothetical protein A3C42_03705 [Chlamydiae bacterium RIFCSPHIGHO2_02_FULL_45_9]
MLLGENMWRGGAGFVMVLVFCMSCYKDHLYVQQEWVDCHFLASTHVHSPDPRQECFSLGERLLVAWKFPNALFCQNLRLIVTVRFWDQSEEQIVTTVQKRWQYQAYDFLDRKILTYRIQVVNGYDEVVETWEHHFWTKLIDLDRKREEVSSQLIQGSVIDRPN